MRTYSSREVIEILEANGWTYKNTRGSHHHYENKATGKKVTVKHPAKIIPIGTLKNISRQTGIRM
jgi:predicted RNA binding protein YcfA (HicA-like mRNA interferase family)